MFWRTFCLLSITMALTVTGCQASLSLDGIHTARASEAEASPGPIQLTTLQPSPSTDIELATLAPTPTLTPAPAEGAIGPYDFPEGINPLTGLVMADPDRLNRRPVVVKISNSPALVRPQSGIGQADLAFEHYTEAGITRFSALFYGAAPEHVGSIRSARLIDYELVPMYDALLAFAGASIGVDKRIYGSEWVKAELCSQSEEIEQCAQEADAIGPAGPVPPSEFADRAYKGVYYGRPYYWRDEEIEVPHNMFVNIDALQQLAADEGQGRPENLSGMAFHRNAPANPSSPGLGLDVRYRTTLARWAYDETTGLYLRSTDGLIHRDANTGQQISAANVVVVYAGHYDTDIIESQWGDTVHWSTQITIWPEGEAVLLRDGRRYDGRWVRPTRPDLLGLRTHDGELLYLKPGNTWFQLVPLPEQMDPQVEWVRVYEEPIPPPTPTPEATDEP